MLPARPLLVRVASAVRAGTADDVRALTTADGTFLAALRGVVRGWARRALARHPLVRGELDDVIQDVLLRVWSVAPRYRLGDGVRFLGWTLRVTRGVVIDHVRREATRRRLGLPRDHAALCAAEDDGGCVCLADAAGRCDGAPDPGEIAMRGEERDAVAEAIAQLPERQRDVLLRWVLHGETLAAVAKRGGRPVSTTRRDAQEALKQLRRLLRRFEGG